MWGKFISLFLSLLNIIGYRVYTSRGRSELLKTYLHPNNSHECWEKYKKQLAKGFGDWTKQSTSEAQ